MGKEWKQWLTSFFLDSKITADDDYSHEIKRHLLLGRKAMTNLDSILKSWDIAWLTKVLMVNVMVFSSSHGWMWEFDHKGSWALKNWHFWKVALEKTLERPSGSKEIQPVRPECSLKGLMLKLKLQYFCHLMRRADLLEKTLVLGKIEGRGEGDDRWWDGWMALPTQWIWVWVNSRSWWWTGRPRVLQSMGHKELDMTERLNWGI